MPSREISQVNHPKRGAIWKFWSSQYWFPKKFLKSTKSTTQNAELFGNFGLRKSDFPEISQVNQVNHPKRGAIWKFGSSEIWFPGNFSSQPSQPAKAHTRSFPKLTSREISQGNHQKRGTTSNFLCLLEKFLKSTKSTTQNAALFRNFGLRKSDFPEIPKKCPRNSQEIPKNFP